MEKGDKKKAKPKKKTQQKQKQKQEQNVIVNINQPVKKQRKRVYKPTKKMIVTQPIRNITTITQIPTERAELYRQVQQPTIGQQAPAQAPTQAPAPAPTRAEIKAPAFIKPKITIEEEPLRAESKFIFEAPLIASSSMLYPEQNLELIKSKYKKVRPLEDYMSDISEANSRAESQHESQILNNPNFYNNNIYDEEKEAEKIDEIDVGEPAGFSTVPIFTTDNLFNERVEAEKIDEFHPLTIISKIGKIASEALGADEEYREFVERREQRKQREEEERQQRIKDEEIKAVEKRKKRDEEYKELLERRDMGYEDEEFKRRQFITVGQLREQADKYREKQERLGMGMEDEASLNLRPKQQEGGDLMPTIQTGLEVGGGGEMVGMASGDMPEEEPKEMVEISLGDVKSGGGTYSKQMVIDKWRDYIDFLNRSNFEVEGSKELKKLKKYELGKEENNKKLKERFDRYDKELRDREQMFEMYNLMNESENVLGRYISREPTENLMEEGAFEGFV